MDHDDPVGDALQLAHQVRRDQHGPPVVAELVEQPTEPHHALGVEAVHRFVEHQDGRITEQRGGDAEALLHAERPAADPPARGIARARPGRGGRRHGRGGSRSWRRAIAGGSRPVRPGSTASASTQRADPSQRGGQLLVPLPADQRPAGGRPDQPERDAHRRRLARAVRTDERGHGAEGRLERDVVERVDGAEPLRDRLEPQAVGWWLGAHGIARYGWPVARRIARTSDCRVPRESDGACESARHTGRRERTTATHDRRSRRGAGGASDVVAVAVDRRRARPPRGGDRPGRRRRATGDVDGDGRAGRVRRARPTRRAVVGAVRRPGLAGPAGATAARRRCRRPGARVRRRGLPVDGHRGVRRRWPSSSSTPWLRSTGPTPGPRATSLLVVVSAALGGGRLLRSRRDVIAERDALAIAHTSAVHETLLLAERTAIARELARHRRPPHLGHLDPGRDGPLHDAGPAAAGGRAVRRHRRLGSRCTRRDAPPPRRDALLPSATVTAVGPRCRIARRCPASVRSPRSSSTPGSSAPPSTSRSAGHAAPLPRRHRPRRLPRDPGSAHERPSSRARLPRSTSPSTTRRPPSSSGSATTARASPVSRRTAAVSASSACASASTPSAEVLRHGHCASGGFEVVAELPASRDR